MSVQFVPVVKIFVRSQMRLFSLNERLAEIHADVAIALHHQDTRERFIQRL